MGDTRTPVQTQPTLKLNMVKAFAATQHLEAGIGAIKRNPDYVYGRETDGYRPEKPRQCYILDVAGVMSNYNNVYTDRGTSSSGIIDRKYATNIWAPAPGST